MGPRFDFMISCRPMAALMFMANAWMDLSTSAFGLMKLIDIPDLILIYTQSSVRSIRRQFGVQDNCGAVH